MASIKLDAPRGPVELDDMRNPVAEHLHQEGREEEDVRLRQGRALEHRHQDLSERQPVLDQGKEEVPGARRSTSRDYPPCKFCELGINGAGAPTRGPGAFQSQRIADVSADTSANGQTSRSLELKGLCKSFGGLQATRDVTLRDHAGRPQGHHRPERRRQDHAVQSDHRHLSGDAPARCCCSARTSPAGRATAAPRSAWRAPSRSPACFRADRARQRAAGDQGAAAVEIRDVALHVVVPRGLRQGASAARAGGLPRPQGHRGAQPVARRAAPARDRARARQRPENSSARRAGRRPVVGRVGRDGRSS